MGTAPVISYHYGAGNHREPRGLLQKSTGIIACFSGAICLAAELLTGPLSRLFVGYDQGLLALTMEGVAICTLSFCSPGLPFLAPLFSLPSMTDWST